MYFIIARLSLRSKPGDVIRGIVDLGAAVTAAIKL